VGIEDEVVVAQQPVHILERTVHLDVGVEVRDAFHPPIVEEVPKQPRLDRRGQLEHGVQRRHLVEALDPEVRWGDHLEGLGGRVDSAVELVDHEHPAGPVGMMGAEGLRQHPGERDVIAGDDRADVHGG
jgi:hypothetical protein